MDKMGIKEATEIRSQLYSLVNEELNASGFETEPIKGGVLIHLPDGYFAKLAISINDATKFDLEAVREEYNLVIENRTKRAEEAKEKARIKEEKAAAKAAKEAASQ